MLQVAEIAAGVFVGTVLKEVAIGLFITYKQRQVRKQRIAQLEAIAAGIASEASASA
jgi:hypothetical protein